MQPLDGVTVLSFEQAVSAPLATRHLADLGARVIKIERPGVGDFARHYDHSVGGLSAYFVWLNRGKESVTLDLGASAPKTIERLVDIADVVIHNLAPQTAKRHGLDPDALRERRRSLIACGISGFAATGPEAQRRAYDLLVQAEAGVLAVTGTEEAPAKVGISIADIAAGMYAYSSILAALFRRERSGEGASIEVSMFDCLVEWMSQPIYAQKYGRGAPRRHGAKHAMIAPYGPFETEDGNSVFVGVQNETQWDKLCRRVLEAPNLVSDVRYASNERRVDHRADLDREVQDRIRLLTEAELLARLRAANLPYAKLASVEDLVSRLESDPDRWFSLQAPTATFDGLRPPVRLSGQLDPSRVIPNLGQDTERVMAELGLPQV
jgi:crotonobetainyl-CoA:carnitine CoA-transferase CaiB-like acyl-CoA transferase